jgi:hypothetical protein
MSACLSIVHGGRPAFGFMMRTGSDIPGVGALFAIVDFCRVEREVEVHDKWRPDLPGELSGFGSG